MHLPRRPLSLLAFTGALLLALLATSSRGVAAQSGGASITASKTVATPGETIQVCFRVPGPGPITVTAIASTGSRVIIAWNDDGTGGCRPATIGLLPGQECFRLDYRSNNGNGSTQTCVQVVGNPSGNTGPGQATHTPFINTDRNSYQAGDTIQYCFSPPAPGPITVTMVLPDGGRQVVNSWTDDGKGGCYSTTAAGVGTACLRLDYSGAGGNGSTQACVSVRAAPGGGSGNNSGTDCPIISNRGPILSGQKLIPRTPISDCNQADNWTLDGKAGHRVTIRMRRVSGDLDSFLELWPPDATSTPEVIDDDSDGNQNARIDRYALQQTGTYRISATRFPGTRTTGQYELTVTDQDGSGGSASTPVVLGGMDLEGYCRSIKNKLYAVANSDNITWNCESWAGGSSGRRGSAGTDFDTSPIPIDMNDVCRVQYQPEAYAQQRDPGDPYSWLCYVNR